jgi:membrane protein YqaA with SNARE-associated domain
VNEGVARFVVVVVVLAWFSTTVVLPVLVEGYKPPPEMNTVMGIVAGGAVAYIFAKKGEDKKNGKTKHENGRSIQERAMERGKRRKGTEE